MQEKTMPDQVGHDGGGRSGMTVGMVGHDVRGRSVGWYQPGGVLILI